jgi:hypothetical protein
MFNWVKKIWEGYCASERESMDMAIESCWYCANRDETAGIERFRCKKEMVWKDGRGLIACLIGVSPWKDYEMDSLGVKGYRCDKYVLDGDALLKSGNWKCSNKYRNFDKLCEKLTKQPGDSVPFNGR